MAKNYFKQVSDYQKQHPRASREHAMKMVSKGISGAKKKKPVKKAAPKKKSITKTERITTIGSHKTKRVSASPISKSVRVSKQIEDLELVLKNTRGTVARNHVKRLINSKHDVLDELTKKLKSA